MAVGRRYGASESDGADQAEYNDYQRQTGDYNEFIHFYSPDVLLLRYIIRIA
jgi:hypothetical protein